MPWLHKADEDEFGILMYNWEIQEMDVTDIKFWTDVLHQKALDKQLYPISFRTVYSVWSGSLNLLFSMKKGFCSEGMFEKLMEEEFKGRMKQ